MKSGVPLSMMFVLVAVCAVVVGMNAPLTQVSVRLGAMEILATSLASMCVFGLLGVVAGFYQFDRRRGVWWGLLIGGAVGLFIVPVVWIPYQESARLAITSVVGSVIVVASGIFLRGRHRKRSPEREP